MQRTVMRRLALVLGLGAVTLLPAAAQAQRVVLGDPTQGQRLHSQSGCGSCHEATPTRAALAPSLSVSGRQRHVFDLAAAIWNHSPAMNERMNERGVKWPELNGNQTADLLAYLYVLGVADAPGNRSRGEAVFHDKHCGDCHGASGGGARGAPNVQQLGKFATPVAMVQAMWNHGPAMQERMQKLNVPRVTFAGDDMVDLLAYLRSRSGSQPTRAGKGDWHEGEKVFAIKGCDRCHGMTTERGSVGPDLSRRPLPRTGSGVAGLLWNHGMRMRQLMDRYNVPVPTFEGSELADLTAYISLLGYIGPPGNPQTGRVLFTQKQCSRCHALDGRGGGVGPDLARSQAVLSPIEAARLMWQHAPDMQKRLEEMRVPWPQLSGSELTDLLAYLTALPGTSENELGWGK